MAAFDDIMDVAKYQKGYVATYQVPDVSSQIFVHHQNAKNLQRVLRGIYRAAVFPHEEGEEQIVAYLWSKERGVLSHETALALHDLSDVLPKRTHITLPTQDNPVRREIPSWLEVHFGEVPDADREWHDVVRVTTPRRTLRDVALDALDLDLLDQAIDQAKARGLVGAEIERELIHALITRNSVARVVRGGS